MLSEAKHRVVNQWEKQILRCAQNDRCVNSARHPLSEQYWA